MKKAGSRAKFSEVDYHFVYAAAQASKKGNAKQFLLVSSLGADPDSFFFYNKLKGEVERDIISLGLPSLSIFRPSLLLGERQELRLAEKIGEVFGMSFSFLMVGPLEKWKPIEAEVVASAMVLASKQEHVGIMIYESHEIKKLVVESS